METLGIILNIVLILASVALIAVVLMQQTKSAGLGGDTASFTARGRKASREAKLQKITVVLGAVIGVLAIAMMIIS